MSDATDPEKRGTSAADGEVAIVSPGALDHVGVRVQHAGTVEAVLDADAHLHVWEPNRIGDRIDCDLTDHVALLVELGIGSPPAQEPHWTDAGGTTVIVSLDLGSLGRLTVNGYDASPEAATALAAAGFVELIRRAAIPRDGNDAPAAEPEQDPTS